MRKLAASLVLILALASLSFAGGKLGRHMGGGGNKTFTGEIMDSQCAMNNSHEQMEKMKGMADDSKMCTLKCVEMGGKFVLQDTAKKITYQLDDQDKPKEFAGQKVKVTGTYDKATKTIHVEKIEAA
jgi:type 1 fimbria pilin